MDTLREHLCIFMIISCWILLSMRSAWDKVGKKSIHAFNIQYIFSKNRAAWEVMWESWVEPDSPRMSIQYGASAVRAGQGKLQTHWKYAIRISFPHPKWLGERALKSPLPPLPALFRFSSNRNKESLSTLGESRKSCCKNMFCTAASWLY